MPQHPVQIHVTITGPKNMAIRTYVRDERGWGCLAELMENEGETPLHSKETSLENTSHAIFDALQSLIEGFAMMMEPGEELPKLVPVAEAAVRRHDSN